jgi:hypothetical protein
MLRIATTTNNFNNLHIDPVSILQQLVVKVQTHMTTKLTKTNMNFLHIRLKQEQQHQQQ